MRNELIMGSRPTPNERKIIRAHGVGASGVWHEERGTGQLQLISTNKYWASPPTTIQPITSECLQTLYGYWDGRLTVEQAVERANKCRIEQTARWLKQVNN